MKSVASATRPDTRESRALALYRARGWEIERIAPDVYLVPSCTGKHTYRVDLSDESCGCPDFEIRGENCKHILAASVKRAKRRGTTVRRLAALQERYDHELADDETRQEWRDQILRLRRRLGL